MVALLGLLLGHAALSTELSPDSPWEITADKISRFEDPASIIAEGNVVLVRQPKDGSVILTAEANGRGTEEFRTKKPLTISGDWIRLDPGLNRVTVRGNAVLDSDDEHITAELANLSLEDHTGTLTNATIYFPVHNLFFAGESVQKTGELTYHLEDGWVTKCDTESGNAPPWSFAWTSGEITYEGFAHFVNATLRVKDVPVLYSPYFAFSTNKKRRTGLLLPEWSQGGRDGVGVLVPLFLDLSPSADMTLYAGHMTERGNVAAVEARYVRDRESKGTFALNYLRDRHEDSVGADFNSDGIYRTEKNRYWLRGKADHDFGYMLGKLDFDLVSDQDYLQEYQDGRIGYDESDKRFNKTFNRGFDSESTFVRSNTAQLSKMWEDMSVNGELRLLNDPTSVRSTSYVWSLPKVIFSGRKALGNTVLAGIGMPELLGATDLTWGAEYIYYWREGGLGAQRLDLHPQLKTPIRFIPYLETTATLGVQKTLYTIDNNSGATMSYKHGILTRTMYDFNLTTSTIFMRDFDVNYDSYTQLTHMMRPQISYDYIPTNSQEAYPSLDENDRIAAKNLITVALFNDFDLASVHGVSRANSRKLAYLKVKQSYDIREDRKQLYWPNATRRPFSAVTTEFGVSPLENLRLFYESDLDVYGNGVTRYELRTDASMANIADFSLEYRYEKDMAINQLNANSYFALTEKASIRGGFLHSFDIDKTSEVFFGLLYHPQCWTMEFLATTTDEEDYRFTIVFQLEGIGNVIGFNQTLYTDDSGGVSFNKNRK